jgi:ubiquinone/menaquinone biosynthesis C-methylase UbiE
MNNVAAFDVLAPAYDTQFVQSLIGAAQRRISRKWLQPILHSKPNQQILEINCGTGADAYWMAAQGHVVRATDASPVMIKQARQKAAGNTRPVFINCAFTQLQQQFAGQQFDCIVSNFAGLNCASPNELYDLSLQFYTLLRPGGYVAVVLFGKYCVWDMIYYLSKLKARQAFQRLTNNKVMVPLTNAVHQPVYYYSASRFAEYMHPLQLVQKKPVGLFIPPSWMEHYMQQHPQLFNRLVQWEERISASVYSNLADHLFMLFKKEAL